MKLRLFEPANDKGLFWTEIWLALMWINEPFLVHLTTFSRKIIPGIADFIAPACIIISFLLGARYCLKKLRGIDLFFILGLLSFYLFSLVIHRENDALTELFPLFAQAIPFYLVGVLFDTSRLKETFFKLSCICVVLQAFVFLYFFRSVLALDAEGTSDLMVPAYQILLHLLFVLWMCYEKPTVFRVAMSVLGLFLIVSFGNRGTLLCVIVFSLSFFLITANNIRRLFVYSTLIFVIFLLFGRYFDTLYELVDEMGMSVRLFSRIEEGMIADDNGRAELINRGFQALDSNGGMGLGLAGDRTLFHGFYVHNLIVELLISYGYILGTLICILLFGTIIRAFFVAKQVDEKVFLALLFCPGIVKLMMSGSYIDEPAFYFLIGFCVHIFRHSKLKNKIIINK